MLKDVKNTIKQSAVYGLSRISIKLVAFVLFPLYSIYFSVEQYGIIVRGEIFWQLLQSFMLYATETAIIRWYLLLEDPEKKKTLVFSVFSFIFILNLIFLILSFYFPGAISELVFSTPGYAEVIKVCLLVGMFETLIGIPLVLLRIKERSVMYVTIVVLETLLSLGLQVYFITSTEYKLIGVFVSKLIASAFVFVLLLPGLIKSFKFKIDFSLLSDVLKFSLPLMAASLVSALFNSQDRFILGYLTDSKEVGLYGLGNNIAGILTFVFISPFALAFPVIFWKKIKDENAQRFYTKSMTYSFLVFVFGALVLSLAAPNFIKIFARNPDYWLAKNIVPFIAFSLVFYGMQVVGLMSFYHDKKTKIVLLILVISSVLNIVFNLFLIPIYGMYGSAISTFASYLISSILIYTFSKKYFFIKWENTKLFTALTTGIILVAPFYIFNISNLLLSIALKCIAIILFPIILYLFRFYEQIEIQSVKQYIRKFTNR